VAAAAGVSVATVSRVLNGAYPVKASTRTRVLTAMRRLDYVVDARARALNRVTSRTVAIAVHDVTAPFFAHIAHGVEQQAAAESRLCLVGATAGDPDRELAFVSLMREQRAEAVVLVGGVVENDEYRARMRHCAEALDAADSRLVLVGRPPLGPRVPATVVEYDNEGGSHALTSHLLSAGHERILLLSGPRGSTTSLPRESGYRRALRSAGVPYDRSLVVHGDLNRASGYERMRKVLGTGADVSAVYAGSDLVAAGVMQAVREAGLRIPDDISVAGYDDSPLAVDVVPALTTVHLPHDELGRMAVRLALHRDQLPKASQHAVLDTSVIVRESVGPPPRRPRRGRPTKSRLR
jgi:LacI family transcriptional regulator